MGSQSFLERKKKRTAYFLEHVYGKKLVVCTACNGSGWYDNLDSQGRSIPCSSCEGTGKTREH